MLYCTRNGDHLDLLIKTGSIQKEKTVLMGYLSPLFFKFNKPNLTQ